ncbi:MAG: hypothetical protein QNJ19_03670 [Woeseiaceae bacterium]|nr:hypothetical protein [Woeseiaceae bacterium]
MQKRALFFIGLAILAGFLTLNYLEPQRTLEVRTLPVDAEDSDAAHADSRDRPKSELASAGITAGSPEPEPFSSVTESGANEPTQSQTNSVSYAASTRAPAVSETEATEDLPDQDGSGSTRYVPRHWDVVDGSAGATLLMESDFDEMQDGQASASLSLSGATGPGQFGGIVQAVRAEGFADQRLRFSGFLKRQDAEGASPVLGSLWIRADDQTGRLVAFENSHGQFLPSEEVWLESTIIIDIPTSAENLFYGATIIGDGRVWVDNLSIAIVDDSFPLTAPLYDRQTTNLVPREALDRPANLSFEDVVPLTGD